MAKAKAKPEPKPYLLACDPGLVSGLVLVQREPVSPLWSYELPQLKVGEALEKVLPDLMPNVELVIERFVITPMTHKKSQAPWSLKVCGVFEYCAEKHGYPVEDIVYSSTSAKAFSTNDKLKNIGLWHRGGAGHANDAFRHALKRLVDTGTIDIKLLR